MGRRASPLGIGYRDPVECIPDIRPDREPTRTLRSVAIRCRGPVDFSHLFEMGGPAPKIVNRHGRSRLIQSVHDFQQKKADTNPTCQLKAEDFLKEIHCPAFNRTTPSHPYLSLAAEHCTIQYSLRSHTVLRGLSAWPNDDFLRGDAQAFPPAS